MRKKWVVRRVVEFVGIWVAIYFIGVQYISPVESLYTRRAHLPGRNRTPPASLVRTCPAW